MVSRFLLHYGNARSTYNFLADFATHDVAVEGRGLVNIGDSNGDMVKATQLPEGGSLEIFVVCIICMSEFSQLHKVTPELVARNVGM